MIVISLYVLDVLVEEGVFVSVFEKSEAWMT
jgi:hypothetical protein